jgi:hypothetical protein
MRGGRLLAAVLLRLCSWSLACPFPACCSKYERPERRWRWPRDELRQKEKPDPGEVPGSTVAYGAEIDGNHSALGPYESRLTLKRAGASRPPPAPGRTRTMTCWPMARSSGASMRTHRPARRRNCDGLGRSHPSGRPRGASANLTSGKGKGTPAAFAPRRVHESCGVSAKENDEPTHLDLYRIIFIRVAQYYRAGNLARKSAMLDRPKAAADRFGRRQSAEFFSPLRTGRECAGKRHDRR